MNKPLITSLPNLTPFGGVFFVFAAETGSTFTMKHRSLAPLGLLLAGAAPAARAQTDVIKLLPAKSATPVKGWFEGAAKYLQSGKVSPGKVPALFVTVSFVGASKPLAMMGRAPDRASVAYAHGEMTRVNLPGVNAFGTKLLFWTNTGEAMPSMGNLNPNPFGALKAQHTLNVWVSEDGTQSFQEQIDGRNRLGRGPQTFSLPADSAALKPEFLSFSGLIDFNGIKRQAVVTLVRGEKGPGQMLSLPLN